MSLLPRTTFVPISANFTSRLRNEQWLTRTWAEPAAAENCQDYTQARTVQAAPDWRQTACRTDVSSSERIYLPLYYHKLDEPHLFATNRYRERCPAKLVLIVLVALPPYTTTHQCPVREILLSEYFNRETLTSPFSVSRQHYLSKLKDSVVSLSPYD